MDMTEIKKDRYNRNLGTVSAEEQQLLKIKSVCVAGCGGLGGTVIENLTRIGTGNITAIDGDVFADRCCPTKKISGNLRQKKPLNR